MTLYNAGDYALYCGTNTDTLNYYNYFINSYAAKQLFDQGVLNNFCVWQANGVTYLGASYNQDLSNTTIPNILPELANCNAAGQGFASCNGQASSTAWVDRQRRLFMHSKASFSFAPPMNYEQLNRGLFDAQFGSIISTLKQDPQTSGFFSRDFSQDGLMYDRLYFARKGNRAFFGTVDENTLIARYENVQGAQVCQAISLYNTLKTTPQSSSKIACIQRPNFVYIIASGSQFADINPAGIWPDLSGKIR